MRDDRDPARCDHRARLRIPGSVGHDDRHMAGNHRPGTLSIAVGGKARGSARERMRTQGNGGT
jgi:hypothetical protein